MALIQLNINRWGQGCCVLCERRVGRFITGAGNLRGRRGRGINAPPGQTRAPPAAPAARLRASPRSHRWLCLEPETRGRERARGARREGETPLPPHTHTPGDGEPGLEGDRERRRGTQGDGERPRETARDPGRQPETQGDGQRPMETARDPWRGPETQGDGETESPAGKVRGGRDNVSFSRCLPGTRPGPGILCGQ